MGDNPRNARIRLLKTVDPQQVIAMLVEEHGVDFVIDSALYLEDQDKAIDLSTSEKIREYLKSMYGFDFDGHEGTDEEILGMAREAYGSWDLTYTACPWNASRIAEVRGIKKTSVETQVYQCRSQIRNSNGGTINA